MNGHEEGDWGLLSYVQSFWGVSDRGASVRGAYVRHPTLPTGSDGRTVAKHSDGHWNSAN